ncbi:MAG: hypothetical protein JJW03_02585 [Desulfosarcina sp.]|nr:hypothetical protein [Desulfobacterales bacterium]
MTERFKNRYRIASARLQSWAYGWNGAYFITICTQQQKYYFGEILNRKMQLSDIGVLADIFWYEIKNHAKNIILGRFVVMPNHVHGILILNNDNHDGCDGRDKACLVSTVAAKPMPTMMKTVTQTKKSIGQQRFQNQGKNTVSSIVGAYKSAVTKHAHRLGYEFAWQSRFHDHIIHNKKSFDYIEEYVISNPRNWEKDKFYQAL